MEIESINFFIKLVLEIKCNTFRHHCCGASILHHNTSNRGKGIAHHRSNWEFQDQDN